MDWSGWKTALEVWLKTPELIAGTILLLLAVGGFAARLAWKYRDHTATQREANLKDTAKQREDNLKDLIASLEGRLRECREDLSDARGELREAVRQAKDEQQRITQELNELRRENINLRATTEKINKEIIIIAEYRELRETDKITKWVQSVRDLTDTSHTFDRHLNALSTANTALEGTLSDITKKIADTPVLTEPSNNGKRSKT